VSDPPASAVHQNAALILSKLGATLALAERTHRLEAAVRMIADSMGDGALIGLLSEDGARVEPVIFHHPDAGAAERMLAAARALPDSAPGSCPKRRNRSGWMGKRFAR
jgi:hypothetical protein